MLAELEQGMANYAAVMARDTGVEIDALMGGGAALTGVMRARFRKGIGVVLDLLDFDGRIADADVVITGEGRIDAQSADGKVLSGIGSRCRKAGIPALALCGILGERYERAFETGITNVFPAVAEFCDFTSMLADKERFIYGAVDRLVRSLKY